MTQQTLITVVTPGGARIEFDVAEIQRVASDFSMSFENIPARDPVDNEVHVRHRPGQWSRLRVSFELFGDVSVTDVPDPVTATPALEKPR